MGDDQRRGEFFRSTIEANGDEDAIQVDPSSAFCPEWKNEESQVLDKYILLVSARCCEVEPYPVLLPGQRQRRTRAWAWKSSVSL